MLKVDEDGFDSNLESVTDYRDRSSISLMLAISSTLISEAKDRIGSFAGSRERRLHFSLQYYECNSPLETLRDRSHSSKSAAVEKSSNASPSDSSFSRGRDSTCDRLEIERGIWVIDIISIGSPVDQCISLGQEKCDRLREISP
jgi:hypothetical protein